MDDESLERRIRTHFERTAQSERPPAFEAMLAKAEADAASRRVRSRAPAWIGIAVAAGVAAAIIVTRDSPTTVDDAALVAALTASTHWSAPSDVLLTGVDHSTYMGLPQFNDLRFYMQEVEPWI